MKGSTKKFQIITHGNNGFESSQFLKQLKIKSEDPENIGMEFFPFSDLDLFNKNNTIEPLIALAPQGTDVSAILVLISLTEIFSETMHKMILNLPSNEFYRKTSEKEWWEQVIVVFSFGEHEGGDGKIQETITRNRGIREIVGKARDRYIWMSDLTAPEDLTHKLHSSIEKINERPFIVKSPDEDIQVITKQPTSENKEKDNLIPPRDKESSKSWAKLCSC